MKCITLPFYLQNHKHKILQNLNEEARQHFRQAAKTAFMTEGEVVREVFQREPPEKWAEEILTRIPDWPFGDQLRFDKTCEAC